MPCADIVSHIPPGLADDEQNRGNLPPHSLLNYGHFGSAGIRLIGRLKGQVRYGLGLDVKDVIDSGFTIKRGSVKGGSEVLLIEHKRESDEDRDFVMPEDQMSTRMVKILGREVDPVKMVYNAIRLAPFLSDHCESECSQLIPCSRFRIPPVRLSGIDTHRHRLLSRFSLSRAIRILETTDQGQARSRIRRTTHEGRTGPSRAVQTHQEGIPLHRPARHRYQPECWTERKLKDWIVTCDL